MQSRPELKNPMARIARKIAVKIAGEAPEETRFELKRHRILKAAASCFNQKGYSGTSLKDVARPVSGLLVVGGQEHRSHHAEEDHRGDGGVEAGALAFDADVGVLFEAGELLGLLNRVQQPIHFLFN